ncbi:2-oxoacid:acceptor oxidoreductase subunit alpha [archaeon]|nr:2-oxoacid:acceptor oxidoreductase subunit alpha [archaeon]
MVDFTWRVGGEAGYGIATAGHLFARMCMNHGLNVFGSREYPSLIRGGHNTFSIRFSDKPLTSQSMYCDLIAALNENTIWEEKDDLRKGGVIIHDDEVKPRVKGDYKLIPVKLNEIAGKHGDAKIMMNTVAIGVSAGMLNFDKKACTDVIKRVFKKKKKVIKPNIKAFLEGYELGVKHQIMKVSKKKKLKKMLVNGNTAFAIGALRAGCNFISAYPMTPATSILEYLCLKAEEYGVRAVQAEDEISAINDALGASFAGARAMTCTSGGGFALMNEGISLAGMSEAPVVIALAQRPGPATGLPTRTGQGDLLFAINAGHGEFTRVVMAPGDVKECYSMALKAFNLADNYQTPVIILLDKHLSVSVNSVKRFTDSYKVNRGKLVTKGRKVKEGHRFKRYEYTKDGVSPRPVPGLKGLTYCFAGDEHDEEGFIVEASDKANLIAEKRLRKHKTIKKELGRGFKIHGKGKNTLMAWGSTKGAIIEAQKILEEKGFDTQFIQVKILAPLNVNEIKKAVKGQLIIIENNRDGQLTHLLGGLDFKQINKYDGRPLHPEEIADKVGRMLK